MELPTQSQTTPNHLFGPSSSLDDNMAEIELFVRYSRNSQSEASMIN